MKGPASAGPEKEGTDVKLTMNLCAFVLVSFVVAGCNGFGGYPVAPQGDAGTDFVGDAGGNWRAPDAAPSGSDAGTIVRTDSGSTSAHVEGAACDPDRDTDVGTCTLSWCGNAYLVCASGTWQCFPADFSCHRPELTDAGTDAGSDAGSDAGTLCHDGDIQGCDRSDCGSGFAARGVQVCVSGSFGSCRAIPGVDCHYTGSDAGVDAAVSTDAGVDAYVAPGTDAGGPTSTVDFAFTVASDLLSSSDTMAFREEVALSGAMHADTRALSCGGVTSTSGTIWYHCLVTRPVGSDFYFAGSFGTRYSATYGSSDGGTFYTMSGWGRSTCGDGAATRKDVAILETRNRCIHTLDRDFI